jgi:hypothetical protein
MTQILVVAPDSDSVERELGAAAGEWVGVLANQPNHTSEFLQGTSVTRQSVETALNNASVVAYFGHGAASHLGRSAALIDGANVGRLRKKTVLAIACHSARNLGRSAGEAGVIGYVGFDDALAVPLPGVDRFRQVLVTSATRSLSPDGPRAVRRMLIAGFRAMEKHYRGPGRDQVDANIYWMAAHINWRGVVLERGGLVGTASRFLRSIVRHIDPRSIPGEAEGN